MPDGCIIVFTSETFHAGVKTYDRKSGDYLSHLNPFAYIVEQNYVSIRSKASKMLNTNKYNVNCPTCDIITNQKIHYEGHVIHYLQTKQNINMLPMEKYYLGIWKRSIKFFEM